MIVNSREQVNIKKLKTIFFKCWRKDTCHPLFCDDWVRHNPTIGQNDITALSIFSIFGGEILVCTKNGSSYFWNRLSSGQKIDLINWPHKLKKTQERNSKSVKVFEVMPVNSKIDIYSVYRRFIFLHLRVLELLDKSF